MEQRENDYRIIDITCETKSLHHRIKIVYLNILIFLIFVKIVDDRIKSI